MNGARVSIPHIRALDGLRGAAVTGVVLYHGDRLKGGYLGVDLFFVLSGYLITSLLLAEWRRADRVSLAAFWARRARRLLPALVVVLLGIAIYCVAFAAPTELRRIRFDTLATLGYVANWRSIAAHQSYFDLFSAPSPLQHTWSLAIEEQFYLVWPLLFVGLAAWWKQRTAQAVLATAVILGGVSTALMFGLYDAANPNRAYFGTDTRSFALFAGIAIAAAIAIWGHTRLRSSRVLLELAAVVSVAVLALMWFTIDGKAAGLYRGGFTVAGVAAATVIAAVANPRRGPIGWLFSFPPLCWLGLISYGLYLWHWPVDVVLNADRVGLTGWPLFAVRTAVALTISVASYYLIEMPIRRGAFRPTQWRIAIPAIATGLTAIMIATTAGAVDATNTTGLRFSPTRHDQVLLLGDSVANSLAPGIDHEGVKIGVGWAAGCRLIHGTLRFQNAFSNDCPWEKLWGEVLAAVRPTRVVILIGEFDLFDVKPAGSVAFSTPGSPGWNEAFGSQLELLVNLVASTKAQLTLLTVPCSGHLGAQLDKLSRGGDDVKRVMAANAVIRQVAARHPQTVKVIDLFGFLCPRGVYQPIVNGVTTRTDGVHLSEPGATLVARWLVPQLGIPVQPAASKTTTTTTPTNKGP